MTPVRAKPVCPNDPLDGLARAQRHALEAAAGGILMRRMDGRWSRAFGERGPAFANADIAVLCERALLWRLADHFAQITIKGLRAAELARRQRLAVEKRYGVRNG